MEGGKCCNSSSVNNHPVFKSKRLNVSSNVSLVKQTFCLDHSDVYMTDLETVSGFSQTRVDEVRAGVRFAPYATLTSTLNTLLCVEPPLWWTLRQCTALKRTSGRVRFQMLLWHLSVQESSLESFLQAEGLILAIGPSGAQQKGASPLLTLVPN